MPVRRCSNTFSSHKNKQRVNKQKKKNYLCDTGELFKIKISDVYVKLVKEKSNSESHRWANQAMRK